MQVNLNFNQIQVSQGKTPELYLYYRLRAFAMHNGGWITKFKLTNNEKYTLLPKLKKSGWLTRDMNKVVSYRKILNRGANYSSFVDLNIEEHLNDMNTFKGFLVASTEALFLKSRQHKQRKNKQSFKAPNNILTSNQNRNKSTFNVAEMPRLRVKKIKGSMEYFGRVYNLELSKFLNLSEKTITRWRQFSIANKFNKYSYKRVNLSSPSADNRTKVLSYDGVDRAYFCKKKKAYMLCDMVINTKGIVPYFSKFYDYRSSIQYSIRD